MKRVTWAIIALVVLTAAAGDYYFTNQNSSSSSVLINISILGGVGAGTVDQLQPNTFTVRQGQQVTLAVLNTDDNTHGFAVRGLPIDTGIILPGHTTRVTFIANQTGTFEYYEPPGYCKGGFGNVCNSVQHMTGNFTVVP